MPIGALLGGPSVEHALTGGRGREPFHLGPLPYSYSALEPVIDQETMHWHFDIHHGDYVRKLNEALREMPVQGVALEDILAKVSRFPKAVRVNGGGHWNHAFFWSVMTDRMEDHEIAPDILKAIERTFHSFDDFKNEFIRVGTEHVGSGWLWCVKTDDGRLKIATTMNQDNPLMDVSDVRGTPILACDLWEHAYYLKFKARRDEFLRRFFTVVNWARVSSLYVADPENYHH